MKLVVQRVKKATLSVEGKLISEIGKGMVVFLGIGKDDSEREIEFYSKKIANMRIFEDENGKMNLSIKDIRGDILLVSQFTLYANTSHGNRPSFFEAEEPKRANLMYEQFCLSLMDYNITVKKGVFGADMQIIQNNDGPVTIIL